MNSVDLLVIQPTPFCNINCSYCYLPDRSNTKKITPEIVQQTIDALLNGGFLGNNLSVVWHAGEPLVLTPSFYEPLYQLFDSALSARGITVMHHIQTNGTLISAEWCDFINKHHIKVGVSVDGPEDIHDRNRKTRSGKGTFEKVMKGIELLRSYNIPYHAIAVINQHSLGDPAAFFRFFYDNGFYELGLNVEEVEGDHKTSGLFAGGLYEEIRRFYSRIFDLYLSSDRHMKVRELERSINSILRNTAITDISLLPTETHQNVPLAIISIDYLGNYSSFSPELIGQLAEKYSNFILGHVKDGINPPVTNPLLREMTAEITRGIEKCRSECDFFYVCGGGAPANKFFENGTFNSAETEYCRYNLKIPIELSLSYLEKDMI